VCLNKITKPPGRGGQGPYKDFGVGGGVEKELAR
jgi:hypothetical protein